LRLLASNLALRDDVNTTVEDVPVSATSTERTSMRGGGPRYVNWQLRQELKL